MNEKTYNYNNETENKFVSVYDTFIYIIYIFNLLSSSNYNIALKGFTLGFSKMLFEV